MEIVEQVSHEDLIGLLQDAGFEVEATGPGRDSRKLDCQGPLPFEVTLHGPTPGRDGYTTFSATACVTLPRSASEHVAQSLQPKLPFCRVYVNGDGALVIGQPVYVGGGVTQTHILELLGFWRSALKTVQEATAGVAAVKPLGRKH